jgi:hypothetical protein
MALPEPDGDASLLGQYVMRAARTIIGGASGHGKTTMAVAMVAAIVTGQELLGETGAGTGPVMIVDLEQGLRSVKRTLREAGLDAREDVYIVRAPDGLTLDAEDELDLAELERLIAAIRPAVVILDPYYKAHRVEANEERPTVDLMRRLDALRERYGFALLLPAHVRKDQFGSNGVRKLTLDDIAGSGAITRGAEVVLGVERLAHGFARLRVLKDRDGDLAVGEAISLTYSKDGGFRVKDEPDPEARARELGADGTWRTAKEWASLLGVGERKAKPLLESLMEAGIAEFSDDKSVHGRAAKAKCWRIPKAETVSEEDEERWRSLLGRDAPDQDCRDAVSPDSVTQSDGEGALLRQCVRVSLETHGRDAVEATPSEVDTDAVADVVDDGNA